MSEILMMTEDKVILGHADGSTAEFDKTTLNFPDPKVGDQVKVFQTDNQTIISKDTSAAAQGLVGATTVNTVMTQVTPANSMKMDKHLFVWLGAFAFGMLGVDRFMRGQVGIGLLKLFFGWLTFGIWYWVDLIIALIKVYSTYNDTDEISFNDGKYTR